MEPMRLKSRTMFGRILVNWKYRLKYWRALIGWALRGEIVGVKLKSYKMHTFADDNWESIFKKVAEALKDRSPCNISSVKIIEGDFIELVEYVDIVHFSQCSCYPKD